jgi:phosphatidylinositol alpha 1,6-mannosyltransferase
MKSGDTLNSASLRIALFTDSLFETNGVATLSQQLTRFAQDSERPFFCAYGGDHTRLTDHASLRVLELERSPAAFPVDKGLYCDPLRVFRYRQRVVEELISFKPDLIHITGPGDLGWLGLWAGRSLQVPVVASWHTNLHEYASRRLSKFFGFMPASWREKTTASAEHQSLRALMRFYRMARFYLAPNAGMVELLRQRLRPRPAFIMAHGVDLDRYSPTLRPPGKRPFRIGYVGRLTAEKNVRAFADLERRLLAAGQDFEILMVGDGGESQWLKKHLQRVQLPGALRDAELAAAFASMDVFVFPSQTDTFGLVVLEAMASGVPVVASPETGARVGFENAVHGFSNGDYANNVLALMNDERLRSKMGAAARSFACSHSWRSVFEQLYETYVEGLTLSNRLRAEQNGSQRTIANEEELKLVDRS